MLTFESLNLIWSKEFIALAWVDDDFVNKSQTMDAMESLKESIGSEKKNRNSAGDETQMTEQPIEGENKV